RQRQHHAALRRAGRAGRRRQPLPPGLVGRQRRALPPLLEQRPADRLRLSRGARARRLVQHAARDGSDRDAERPQGRTSVRLLLADAPCTAAASCHQACVTTCRPAGRPAGIVNGSVSLPAPSATSASWARMGAGSKTPPLNGRLASLSATNSAPPAPGL